MDEATFLSLSVALTGFETFDLRATGQLAAYCDEVGRKVDSDVLREIVTRWNGVQDLPASERIKMVEAMVIEPALGMSLKRIIMLWYTGSWYVSPPYDATTLSPRSYIQGLMWKAIRSHPMAAAPQGYGAWSLPPPVEGGDT